MWFRGNATAASSQEGKDQLSHSLHARSRTQKAPCKWNVSHNQVEGRGSISCKPALCIVKALDSAGVETASLIPICLMGIMSKNLWMMPFHVRNLSEPMGWMNPSVWTHSVLGSRLLLSVRSMPDNQGGVEVQDGEMPISLSLRSYHCPRCAKHPLSWFSPLHTSS